MARSMEVPCGTCHIVIDVPFRQLRQVFKDLEKQQGPPFRVYCSKACVDEARGEQKVGTA